MYGFPVSTPGPELCSYLTGTTASTTTSLCCLIRLMIGRGDKLALINTELETNAQSVIKYLLNEPNYKMFGVVCALCTCGTRVLLCTSCDAHVRARVPRTVQVRAPWEGLYSIQDTNLYD